MEFSSLEEHILYLEKCVMQYDVERMNDLLADDFYEIGSSGNTYTKQDQLDAAASTQTPIKYTVTDFKIKELAPDVVMATYRTLRHHDMKYALRCSIWKKNSNKWQMLFHQGTPTT
ncbi:nuclear transport factor 2 family protein [Paenibacillus alkalitolerans]|uniref:nuclear transport factor 2 family protein n=1 Tax=Paenibacillus alkalitolerans TaxID=2799335 RepID=UPI0018F6C84D|nr:DUF4440 domain-containing protein [Paenibacillus alkalitolerans]